MKRVIMLFSFLYFVLNISFSQTCNCNHIITLDQKYLDGSKLNILPGDTVCIEAGERTSLKLINFHGSPTQYIVFQNYGGAVIVKNNTMPYGIAINESSYFRFTGSGDRDIKFGIKVLETKNGASGLGVGDGSTNFEIDHIEIANTGFAGIFSKTDPVCDLSKNRGNFTQYQSIYHDNYIHNTGGEGMYIGHSFYSGWKTTCNGVSTTLYPSELKGVRIYNNVIDSAGWDGIQVGCVTEDCEIYGNTVTNYGVEGIVSQHTGIQIGGGTVGKCYNNKVLNGSGIGIAVFGLGNNEIFNNIVLNAGYNFYPNDSTIRIYGIFCDDRETIPGSSFKFYNNTIVNSKSDGIRFMSTESKNNLFYNNIIINPGSLKSYTRIPKQSPYINIGSGAPVDAIISNNYFHKDASQILFVDALNADFRLKSNSPAIDDGKNLSQMSLLFDVDYNARPSGSAYDIGAYEYQKKDKIIIKSDEVNVDANDLNVEPGDTIYLEASTKRYLRLVNFHGTDSKYIVFKNHGGPVIIRSDDMYFGLKIANSSYFRFTGTGTNDIQYGIKVMGTKIGAAGLSVDEGSTNFEVDHIEIANIGSYGIVSKTNPQCDLATNRDSFTQYNSVFHDNYIHNTLGDGINLGHLNYLGLNSYCNGESNILYPSVLKGVKVYNNIVDSIYSDGIRISSAIEDCEVYGNTVTNYGLKNDVVPKTGIVIGFGTSSKCYNNYIADGAGNGITLSGLGGDKVFNNVIVNAGRKYYPTDSCKRAFGILCEDKSTIADNTFYFYNNTIVNPKSDGIRFTSTLSKNNQFFNNIIINPGSLFSYAKYYPNQNPYINTGSKTGIDATVTHNFFDKDFSNIQFVDTLNRNFRLTSFSPAKDAGINLFDQGVYVDFDNNGHSSESMFDMGAYESEDNYSSIQYQALKNANLMSKLSTNKLNNGVFSLSEVKVFPNPNHGNFSLTKKGSNSAVNLIISDVMGRMVYSKTNIIENTTDFNINLEKGVYYFKICHDNSAITQKIIVGER